MIYLVDKITVVELVCVVTDHFRFWDKTSLQNVFTAFLYSGQPDGSVGWT